MVSRLNPAMLAAVASLLVAPALADQIIFTSGDLREGRVEEIFGKPDKLALTTAAGRIEIPRTLIQKLTEQDDATDFALIGNQFLKIQSYEKAAEMFQKALAADPENSEAIDGMETARKRIADQHEQTRRQQLAQNATQLVDVRKLIEEEDFEGAESLIGRIQKTDPSEDQQAAIGLLQRDLYLAWGLSRLDRLDNYGAEMYLEKVLQLDPTNVEANDALLQVWERDTSKKDKVIGAYRAKLKNNPDDVILNQKLADILLSLNRYEEAIEPLIRISDTSTFRANRYDERLLGAMQAVSQSKASRGDLEGAIAEYQRLLEIFPSADTTPLAILQYNQRINELESDDWEGRAALLKMLEDQGLDALAEQEAEKILRNDPENERALALLRRRAESDLKEVNDVFNKGEYILARSMASSFAEKNTRFPDLVQKASDLYAKADLEAAKQAKRAREQARDIAAQADAYLAESKRNIELYKSADNSNRSSILSYKAEALKYARRSIDAYQVALQIDPSLGPLVGGLDLNTKLADARALESTLTRTAIKIYVPPKSTRNNDEDE